MAHVFIHPNGRSGMNFEASNSVALGSGLLVATLILLDLPFGGVVDRHDIL
jgi:hypothetical protein